MTNKLLKPYTLEERANFVVENNHNNGLRIEETETALYALKDSEILVDGEIIDLTQDTAWIQEQALIQFQKDIQYQHNAFNEFAREIIYQIQYNTALSNTTMILDLEQQLQIEQQAVIARINEITEAYNENNQQST